MSTETKQHVEKLICDWCGVSLDNPRAKFCSDKCRMKRKRHGIPPEQPEQNQRIDPNKTSQPEQIDPNNPNTSPEQTTRTEVDPNKTTRPEQPIDSGEVHILRRADLGRWRGTRPLYLDQPTGFEHLSDYALVSRLTGLNPWQGSPEYAERVYRLVHGLTDYMLPANMAAEVA